MPPSFPSQRELLQIAETALVATVGGVGFYLIGFPGGLVSGSMLAVAVAALAGRPNKISAPAAGPWFVFGGIFVCAGGASGTPWGNLAWAPGVARFVLSG